MLTFYTLSTPLDGAVLVGFLALLLLVIYLYRQYSLYRRLADQKKKRKRTERSQIEGNRNAGNQWKGEQLTMNNNYYQPPSREVTPYEAHLQDTINILLQKLMNSDQVRARLMDQNDKLREENDALWDENNRIKYEQANRFPVLDMKKDKEERENRNGHH